jgi:copper homeostasis protein
MTRLEICIDNLESLFTAQAAGADRIELCSALGLGGLTPSYGFMQQVARHATTPVYAMIRPRAGDFCFGEGEFDIMLQDIAAARAAGLQGVVVGLLDEDGRVPEGKLRQLVEAAGPLGVTFHRAIDLSSDWRLDLETIVAAGCERILSSGHAPTALAGVAPSPCGSWPCRALIACAINGSLPARWTTPPRGARRFRARCGHDRVRCGRYHGDLAC